MKIDPKRPKTWPKQSTEGYSKTSELETDTRRSKPKRKHEPTSTVGRGKSVVIPGKPSSKHYQDSLVSVHFGDSMDFYKKWPSPVCIISDGGYGILGFEGDTSDHLGLPDWYEPHIKAWSELSTPQTTLWFWNSEIGWAAVHPILEKYGWRYVNCNIWNKGLGHIAGNVNTKKIRRFPVVTEVCVQYIFESRIDGELLKKWLRKEWKRSGLPLKRANEACGVKDAAVRKYLDQGHLWYFPPPEAFEKLAKYANEHGKAEGRPYYSRDGKKPMLASDWAKMRSRFTCPHGVTNVWERNPVNGKERLKADSGKAVHLNQKPLDLMTMIINASTEAGEIVWEPFGGLFSGALAAKMLNRKAFAAEVDSTYFQYGVSRFSEGSQQHFDLGFQAASSKQR